jgi:hypothetical protein
MRGGILLLRIDDCGRSLRQEGNDDHGNSPCLKVELAWQFPEATGTRRISSIYPSPCKLS